MPKCLILFIFLPYILPYYMLVGMPLFDGGNLPNKLF